MELDLVECSGDNDDGSKFGGNETEQIRTVAAVSALKSRANKEKIAFADADARQKPTMKSETGMCLPQVKLKSHIPSSAGTKRVASIQVRPSSNLETKMVKDGNLMKEGSAGNLRVRGTKKLQSHVKTGEPKYLENGSSTLSKSGEIPKVRNTVNQTPRNQAKVSGLSIYHRPSIRPGEGRTGVIGGDKGLDKGRRLSQLSDVTSGTSGRNRSTSAALSQRESINDKSLKDESRNNTKTLNEKESPIQQKNNKTGHNESTATGCCPKTTLQTDFESNATNKVSPQNDSQPNDSSQQSSAVLIGSGVLKKLNEMPSEFCDVVLVAKNAILGRTSTPVLSKVDPASRVRAGGRDRKKEQELQNKKEITSRKSISLKGSGQLKQKSAASAKRSVESSDGNRELGPQPPQTKQHEQHYSQPDLVPNDVTVEKQRIETNELESLCQSFASQVNFLKAEVSRWNDWFHALLIAAQYFLQMSDAEERRELKDRLKSTLENLNATTIQLEDLVRQRDDLNDEVRLLKEEEQSQRNRLLQEHQLRLKELEESLQLLHSESINRLMKDNAEKLGSLEMEHSLEVKKLKEIYDQKLNENEKEHSTNVSILKSQHEEVFRGLKKQHDAQLNDITLYFDHMKLSLSEKVNILRNECEEMQRKESDYMESCQRDMEQKLHFALLPFRHLPQEIESLKAVLEVRNVELHNIRCQNLELHRQLEELPVAHEMIRRLEQKVENLEAVASIRTDYERGLSEKHQQLLRRLERESKANKRLSMDKEELLWRLSFQATDLSPSAEASSPESFQQMLKNGPISGGDSSVVGDASKLASHSRSPSASHNPPGDMHMQRSETYDLFCQNLNDVGTDKTSPVLNK